MQRNLAMNRLALLPVEQLSVLTYYLEASSICKLFMCGHSKLNYLLTHGGVLSFCHELDLRRKYWPTLVKHFPLIHEFTLSVTELPFTGERGLDDVFISAVELSTLPRTLKRLRLTGNQWLRGDTSIFSLFPQLEEYECTGWCSTTESLQQQPAALHRLSAQHLTTKALDLMHLEHCSPFLESLELSFTSVTENKLCEIVAKFPENLTNLSVVWHSQLADTMWLNVVHLPVHLRRLDLQSSFVHVTREEVLEEMPATLTYLRIPLANTLTEWKWLPPNLTHLRLTNLDGRWELMDLSSFPRTLTYLRFRHSFIMAPDDAPLCAPPNLRVYKGVEKLSVERCLQLPSTLTSLTVCEICAPTTRSVADRLSQNPSWNFLPPKLTTLYLQALEYALPLECVRNLRKTLMIIPSSESVRLLKLSDWEQLQTGWIEFPREMMLPPNYVFPTTSLTSLSIEYYRSDYDWATFLPNTLKELDVKAEAESMMPSGWFASLPPSLVILNLSLELDLFDDGEINNNNKVFDAEVLNQTNLPELRYFGIIVAAHLDFSKVLSLPPRLGHVSWVFNTIKNFDMMRLVAMCPEIAEVDAALVQNPKTPMAEARRLGIRISI